MKRVFLTLGFLFKAGVDLSYTIQKYGTNLIDFIIENMGNSVLRGVLFFLLQIVRHGDGSNIIFGHATIVCEKIFILLK